MTICGIYLIRNLRNGKCYVGSSRDCHRRFSEHRTRLQRGAHINGKLQASWNKHGPDAFDFSIFASVLNPDDLAFVEQKVLDDLSAVNTGYNLAPIAGTTSGWRASSETRQRMSEAAKRRDHSVQVAAMAKATKGKKRPTYVIEAMQRGRREQGLGPESRARMASSAIARSRYSQTDREAMARAQDAGSTLREIGAMYGVPHQCVHKYIAQWRASKAVTS